MKGIKSNYKNNWGNLYYYINLFLKSIVLLYWINYAYKVFT